MSVVRNLLLEEFGEYKPTRKIKTPEAKKTSGVLGGAIPAAISLRHVVISLREIRSITRSVMPTPSVTYLQKTAKRPTHD